MTRSIIPCPICAQSFKEDEKPVFCPDCGQIYHQKCWSNKGNECKIKGCHGDTKVITTFIEKLLLNSLKLQSNLKSECPNCKTSILILYRYCPNCSSEANPPSIQNSFYLFPILKFFHNYKQRLIIVLTILFIVGFCLVPGISGLVGPTQITPPPSQTKVRYITQTPFSAPATKKLPTATTIPTKTPTTISTASPIVKISPSTTPSPALNELKNVTVCQGAPKPRVSVNNLVEVVTSNSDRLILRTYPEISIRTEITRLNSGERLKIFDGPYCVRDPKTGFSYWFWEVKVKSTGVIGYVAEGETALYYIKVVK